MSQPMLAVVAGHVTLDRYGTDLLPGGGAFYGARTLAGLGARAALYTAVGKYFDVPGAFAGLEMHLQRGDATTVFVNRYHPDRGREQWLLSAAQPVFPALLPADLVVADLLFLSPVFGEIDIPSWTAAVSARVTGLSVQGLIRTIGAMDPEGARRVVPKVFAADREQLRGVDLAVLSEEDLAGQGDLVDRLRQAVPVVALTRGARGAVIFQGDREHPIGVYSTREVDPTGAGDTFAAALLLGIARELPIPEAGRLAAAAASIVIESRGGETLHRIGEAYERADRVGCAAT